MTGESEYARNSELAADIDISKILEASPDGVKTIDSEGRVVTINAAGLMLLGIRDFESVRGSLWSALWPLKSRSAVDDAIVRAKAGATSQFTAEGRTSTGEIRWCAVSVTPLAGRAGAVSGMLAIVRDITEFKATESLLTERKQYFEALADNISQLAWMADGTGYIFWFNKRWFEYTGTTLKEMQGWGWQKTQHPDHQKRVMEKLSQHITSGEAWEDTFPLRGADGSYRWFLSRALPIRADGGAGVSFWCGTNTDITEDRDTALRLRQKARLIELSHEAILVWDLERGIQSWNNGCVQLYGFSAEEAIGKSSHELLSTIHPVNAEQFEENLRRTGRWSGELRHTAKNGSEIWVESRQELLDTGDRLLVMETNRDITARRQSDELRQLLLGELDHRVKNTLAIVQSIATQTLRTSVDLRHFAAAFSSRLQALSRAHAILVASSWYGADLREAIEAQITSLGAQHDHIVYDGPDVFLPAQVSLQLSLIIHELVSNAIRYGALSMPSGSVSISWRLNGNKVLLRWLERGGPRVTPPARKGFGTLLIERIGNLPQLTATLSFEPDGLSCAMEAEVAQHGATKKMLFNPRSKREPLSAGVPTPEPAANLVLAVVHEPKNRIAVEELLRGHGYNVVAFRSEIENMLAELEITSAKLVVLDGDIEPSLLSAAMQVLRRRQVACINVSNFAAERRPVLLAQGSAGVIQKPIEPYALLQTVDKVFRGDRGAAQLR